MRWIKHDCDTYQVWATRFQLRRRGDDWFLCGAGPDIYLGRKASFDTAERVLEELAYAWTAGSTKSLTVEELISCLITASSALNAEPDPLVLTVGLTNHVQAAFPRESPQKHRVRLVAIHHMISALQKQRGVRQ